MPESMYKPAADLSTSAPVNLATVNDQEGTAITVSPTGTAVIPPVLVPYLLIGAGVLQVVGEEIVNPAPWTAARVVGLAVKVLGFLAVGASPGLRRQPPAP